MSRSLCAIDEAVACYYEKAGIVRMLVKISEAKKTVENERAKHGNYGTVEAFCYGAGRARHAVPKIRSFKDESGWYKVHKFCWY
jgi:hypothetical protein